MDDKNFDFEIRSKLFEIDEMMTKTTMLMLKMTMKVMRHFTLGNRLNQELNCQKKREK